MPPGKSRLANSSKDLITYKVKSLQPFHIEEVVEGSGKYEQMFANERPLNENSRRLRRDQGAFVVPSLSTKNSRRF
jgi:hypothetical protein